MPATQLTSPTVSIAPETHIGAVSLAVSDLTRAESFYRDTLGLRSVRTASGLDLSADGKTTLLSLTELPGARRQPRGTTGLFHFALLLPIRRELGRTLQRLVAHRYALTGASDHLVSEALYLNDPDGNGIELYRDRPRSEWKHERDGEVRMAVDPLDLQSILDEAKGDADPESGIAPGTTMGHIHLHVANLAEAKAFYNGALGFDIMTDVLPGALFVAAGGYHHHIGLNTWAGAGAPPAPADSVGLRRFTIEVPTTDEQDRLAAKLAAAGITAERTGEGIVVQDPSRNTILLAAPREE